MLLLKPHFESKVWHGSLLSKLYDCNKDVGEAWVVSALHNKSSIVTNGIYQGKTLEEVVSINPSLFGLKENEEFPILIKIIDADEDLSVQVHPDNEYAKKRHNANGKFECWYFLEGNKANQVVVGTTCKNKEELKEAIDTKKVMDVIKYAPLYDGLLMGIKPGTVHALKGGSLVLEVQQPSDITYRVYDYDRQPPRELHVEDSLNVIDFEMKPELLDLSNGGIYSNKYFDLDIKSYDNEKIIENKSFTIIFVVDGNGTINNEEVSKNTALIVTSDERQISIKGNLKLAITTPNK